jgi:hypothetical protein
MSTQGNNPIQKIICKILGHKQIVIQELPINHRTHYSLRTVFRCARCNRYLGMKRIYL